MAQSLGNDRAEQVRQMFARIARRYDRTNRWMTWGQDLRWRWEVLRLAQIPPGGRLLDVGTGTGDIALKASQLDPSAFIVGADFTIEMQRLGQKRDGGDLVSWVTANALALPFSAVTFDAVISGYLLRNVVDVDAALAEQYRLLKPGGRMVSLDTTPPPDDFWYWPTRFYLHRVIPILGRLLSGDSFAYGYLAKTTQGYIPAERLAEKMEKAGFREVKFSRFMGGAMAIHCGIKVS